MSTSKVSSPLKYSIATFLLCTSALATGLSIYPISLAIFNATAIPLLFVAIASVSAIVALSSAVYLIKSAISAINTCVALEEKPHSNDISAKTPVATTIQPSLPTLNSKEPVTNSDTSTKIPEKIPVTLGTAILQVSPVSVPPPPPLPNQGVSTLFTPPPPPPFPSQNSSISSLPGQNFSMSYNFSMQIRKGHKLKKVESQIGSNVGSNDPRANLLKAIREGIKLKKVESQIESNVGSNDPRANLLKEIRAGIQLKKVESQKSNEANTSKQAKNQKGDKISAIRRENVAQILARRVHVEFSNSESEHSRNESDWSDDDQASNKKEEKKLIETQKSMPSTITSSEIESNSGPFIPPPPPLPSQDVSVPPPPPLSTEGLNNWKPLKNSDISKKSLGSTTSKNLSHNKQKSLTVITPELLQEHLKKMRKKNKDPEDLTKESNVEIKDNKDNVKHKTQEKYVERVEKQQEEKDQVESQIDHDFIYSIVLEYISASIKLTDAKKGKSSGQSSDYASDLEEDQPPQSKNVQLLPTTVMKIDNIDPINSEAKKSSFWKKFFNRSKKKTEQKTPECISRV